MQEQEDEGKKVGKKGLFELSLCAKQLPGLLGASARRRKRLRYSFPLFLPFAVSVLLCRYLSPIEHWGIDAARKCRSSFAPIVSSLIIEWRGGCESERTDNGAVIWNLGFQICYTEDRFLLPRFYLNLNSDYFIPFQKQNWLKVEIKTAKVSSRRSSIVINKADNRV